MASNGRRSSVLRIIGWMANIALFALIGLLFYLSIPVKGEKNIHLKPASISGIITQLSQKGYDVGIIDKYLMVAIGKPQHGWIYLGKKKMHRLDFLLRLTSARSSFHKVTLLPGETTVIFLRGLSKTLNLNETKLMQQYRKQSLFREAGILAESYHIPSTLQEKGVIRSLLKYSTRAYKKLSIQMTDQWDSEGFNRLLTVASIIQKEAANKQEMPLVASVIYNRLQKNMRLQMDGTLNYGEYSHIKVTPKRIKGDTSTYNTYRHRGLPKYPVCAVSVAAIKAAARPAPTKYLYFMRNSKGTHDFAKDYKTHLKNIKKKRKKG